MKISRVKLMAWRVNLPQSQRASSTQNVGQFSSTHEKKSLTLAKLESFCRCRNLSRKRGNQRFSFDDHPDDRDQLSTKQLDNKYRWFTYIGREIGKLKLISKKYLVMAAHSPLLERIEVLCQGGRLENLSYWLIVTNLPVRWSFFPDDSPRF